MTTKMKFFFNFFTIITLLFMINALTYRVLCNITDDISAKNIIHYNIPDPGEFPFKINPTISNKPH